MSFNEYMELYKIIREKFCGNVPNRLAKALRITLTTLKHYEQMPVSTREILLVKLQKLSGLSVAEFWALLEKEATKEDRARRKKSKIESGDL